MIHSQLCLNVHRGCQSRLSIGGHAARAPRESRARAAAIASRNPEYLGRAWIAIAAVAALEWLWAERVGCTFTGSFALGAAVAILAAIGCFYGFTGRDRKLAELGHYCALWIAFPVAINIYSYLIATLRLPLRDVQLAGMDAALGFHWLAWLGRIEPYDLLQSVFRYAYNSIFVQIFASVVYFSLAGRRDRNRELLWTSMISAFVCVSLSGFFPAYGPYTNGKMPEWSAVLQSIRDGGVTNFRIADMQGIVAFPSFHTILGILVMYAHRPPARTFVPVAILNVLMLVAIPFAGHHYLVDMIAGAVVAAVSIAVVQAVMRPRSLALPQGV